MTVPPAAAVLLEKEDSEIPAFLSRKLKKINVTLRFDEDEQLVLKAKDPAQQSWVDIAEAVAEGCVLKRCAACPALMWLGGLGGHFRTDAQTCSNRCRVRAQRAGLRFRKPKRP